MATVASDLKTDATSLETQLAAHVSALSKAHTTVSYGLIAALVLLFVLCGVGGYFGLKMHDADMARAEATEKQYNADRKDLTAQLTVSKTVINTADKAQQVIVKVVHDRDTATDAAIAKVTAPGKTALDALQDLSVAYKGTIKVDPAPVTADGQLVFPVLTVQGFTSTKLDRDRLFDDLGSSAANLKLEQSKTASLTLDVTKANATLDAAQKTIGGYKAIAKHSKLRAFAGGALKVGIFALGCYAGHKI